MAPKWFQQEMEEHSDGRLQVLVYGSRIRFGLAASGYCRLLPVTSEFATLRLTCVFSLAYVCAKI